jgi:hypothetical protein
MRNSPEVSLLCCMIECRLFSCMTSSECRIVAVPHSDLTYGVPEATYLWGGIARIDVVRAPVGTQLAFYGPAPLKVRMRVHDTSNACLAI